MFTIVFRFVLTFQKIFRCSVIHSSTYLKLILNFLDLNGSDRKMFIGKVLMSNIKFIDVQLVSKMKFIKQYKVKI